MDSGIRNVLIALAARVAIVALAVISSRVSRTREAEGEKPYMKAVEKQLQLDEKDEFDEKGESFDKAFSEEDLTELETKLNEMVRDGELSAEDAQAKMTAIRQGGADKNQAGAKETWKTPAGTGKTWNK